MKTNKLILITAILLLSRTIYAQGTMPVQSDQYPVCFSHVGITVPDIKKAIDFYTKALGWYYLSGPILVKEDNPDSRATYISRNIYGRGWESFQFAHLVSADGIGFEIFEFKKNTTTRSTNDPYKTGIYHFAVQDPNIQELISRIIKFGGKQKSDLMEIMPGEKPYKMVYMEDPFGNLIEIYTHAYILHNEARQNSGK